MRIIFVPQYPTPMRYQEWWWWKFAEEFAKVGMDVLILGADRAESMKHRRGTLSMFSPINAAIELECAQIDEYMNLKFEEDDVMFIADTSFPGFFTNVLFHKKPPGRVFGFCHATSLNTYDYFEPDRVCKFPIETSHTNMMDAVFVGSDYHENKLGWPNTLVTRLPYPPLETFRETKIYDIVSASRPTPQKVDAILEMKVEKDFSAIIRQDNRRWEDYYKFLARSKVLLITSREDTFGYQIVDAVLNDCIPIAPNRCAYPELLPRQYLYDTYEELYMILDQALWGRMETPKLKCDKEMKDFYKNITEIIGGIPKNVD